MRRSWSNAIAVVIVAMLIVGVWFILRPQSSGNPPEFSEVTTTDPSASSAARPTDQGGDQSLDETMSTLSEAEIESLKQSFVRDVARFEKEFHTFTYQDTPEIRGQRLRPFASDKFYAELLRNLSVEASSGADQVFVKNKLSSSAEVPEDGVYGELHSATSGCADTYVGLVIASESGTSTQPEPMEIVVSRFYVLQDGMWLADENVKLGARCPHEGGMR